MNKENVVYIHNAIVLSHEEQCHIICRKMVGTGGHHIKQSEPDSKRQIFYVCSLIWNLG
jgi:hypothetical protein